MFHAIRHWTTGTLTLGLALTATFASAEEITVEGVHLCCGACVKAVSQSLADVEGVSKTHVNKDDAKVTFTAMDEASAQRGLLALAEAGFYGKPSIPGPDFGLNPDQTASEIQISSVHMCCPGCSKSVEAALKKLDGVQSVETQAKAGKVTLKGDNINLAATLKALHEAGFHGSVK